jgi:hypothetical protein
VHVTNGYRDGLIGAKESSLQQGFDEGFPFGASAGLKAGWVLGVLQGLERSTRPEDKAKVRDVLKAAKETLAFGEVVEVMKVEEAEDSQDTKEDPLVMEDVKIKDDILGGWQIEVQKVLDSTVVE